MMTVVSSPSAANRGDRATPLIRILVGAAIVELILFLWLVGIGHNAFLDFIWTPDTTSYIGAALELAEDSTLIATTRTLGYPVFAAAGYVVGGKMYGPYVVIAAQLLLNLVLTWLGWRLLQRMAPTSRQRGAATLLLFWAGMGMAAFLMTDFLAGLCFAIFLYGFLFWRHWRGLLVAASALAAATLTRPTFTFVPLLLPVAAYLVRHISTKIPPLHVLIFAVFSIGATSLSLTYQYTFNRYVGVSPLLIYPIQEMLYLGVARHETPSVDYATFQQEFAIEIEKRAGREFDAMSWPDRETYAKQLFREKFMQHPFSVVAVVASNAVKYVFAPIESLVSRAAARFMTVETYERYLRPGLTALCLPLFLLSLVPPVAQARPHRMYYALMLLFLVYIIGFSAIGAGSGERIRFPILAFMLPVCAWNVEDLRQRLIVGKRTKAPIVSGTRRAVGSG